MLRFVGRKLVEAVLVVVFVSIVTFSLVATSGDLAVAIAGDASGEEIQQIREYYGLDRSIVARYSDWAGRALQGDFGTSFFSREKVTTLILARLPVTAILGVISLAIALAIAIPLGTVAATRPGSWLDRGCQAIAIFCQAMPSFWTGLLMIMLFAVKLRVLPVSGNETWKHFIMPSLALGLFVMPVLMRLTRAGMVEALSADYVRTARAKGLRRGKILFKHALRNGILPVVSVSAVELGFLFGGTVIIETVFSLNGIGQLAWNSIVRSDFRVVQAIVMIVAVVFVGLNLAADFINAFLDPRIRRE